MILKKDAKELSEIIKIPSEDLFEKTGFSPCPFCNRSRRHLHSLNDYPVILTTSSGSMHRTWISFRSAVNHSADKAILEDDF